MFECTTMERRKHFWNGTWGRLARRDVYLYEDGGRWWVEAREGGAEGRSRWDDFTDEDAALARVLVLLDQPGQWTELG